LSYKPELGDEVWTTDIAPANEEEIKKGATKGLVRAILSRNVDVVYGVYFDRAEVSISSCTLIKRGKLDPIHLEKHNPFIFA
jgi:hypothetical protein